MSHNINFSSEFKESFDGTAEQLTLIINNIQKLISSGDLKNNASSILYGDDLYDSVISITI